MKEVHEIADLITEMLKKRNISVNRMLRECGLGKNVVHDMKRGRMPGVATISKIAHYLGVSTDYIIGNTDDPTPPKKALTLDEEIAAEYYKMSVKEREQLKEYMEFLKIRKNLRAELKKGLDEMSCELRPEL